MHRKDLSDVLLRCLTHMRTMVLEYKKKNEQNIAKSPSYVVIDIPDMKQAMLTIKVNLDL